MYIYLSYRRDGGEFAIQLYEELVRHFGEANVFTNLEDLQACDAVVVAPGLDWDIVRDDPDDVFRREIREAVLNEKAIIPIFPYSFGGNDRLSIQWSLEQFGRVEQSKIFYEAKPFRTVISILETIGKFYHMRRELDRALEYYERALGVAKDIPERDQRDTFEQMNNVGRIRRERGEFDRALESFEEAIALWGETNPGASAVFRDIGRVYNDLGDHDRAAEHRDRAHRNDEMHKGPPMSFSGLDPPIHRGSGGSGAFAVDDSDWDSGAVDASASRDYDDLDSLDVDYDYETNPATDDASSSPYEDLDTDSFDSSTTDDESFSTTDDESAPEEADAVAESADLARMRNECRAEPSRSASAAVTGDTVDCSVFAPPVLLLGRSAIVQVFVHVPEQAFEANRMAQEFDTDTARRGVATLESDVQRGTRLMFDLVIQRLEVQESPMSLVWRGKPAAVQFAVEVPLTTEPGTVIGTLNVHQGPVPVGHIKFKLEISEDVDQNIPPRTFVGDSAKRYSMAFVSYASGDRAEVVRCLQTLRAVGIEYFQDVEITPGDRWMQELYSNIDACDLFLLCWSRAAHDSEWVRKEVEHALARKGGNDLFPPEIRPLILEGPPIVPPWPELSHLHFNDRLLYLLLAGGLEDGLI